MGAVFRACIQPDPDAARAEQSVICDVHNGGSCHHPVAAFTVLGLGGIFKNAFKSQAAGLTTGTIFVCLLRYMSHVIVGFTVWRDISIPAADALIYSFVYNATYMLPETIITVVGGITLSRMLDIRGEAITRAAIKKKMPDLAVLFSGLAKTLLAIAGAADVALVFSKLQNAETGKFDITQITEVSWPVFAGISVAAVLLSAVFLVQAKRVPADSGVELKWLFRSLPAAAVIAAAAADAVYIFYNLKQGNADMESVIKMAAATLAVLAALIWTIRRRKNR